MRILVIAPDQGGLNTRIEVRQIQRKHHMSVLDGTVTPQDIYDIVRETAFDVHHYATHGGPDGILLSGGVLFSNEEIGQVARIHETPCLFFNSCNSARTAANVVRHGVRYAVHTNIDLPDADAWKAAVAFYESLQNGHGKDFAGAYVVADGGNGDYGFSIDTEHYIALQRAAAAAPAAQPAISRAEVLRWLGLAVGLSVGLSWLIVRLGGG